MTKNLQSDIEQLDEIVKWFESSNLDVNEALEKYKQAEKLAKKINDSLSSLKNEVSILKVNFEKD